MYKNQRKYQPRNRKTSGNFGQRTNGNRGHAVGFRSRKMSKKLDFNLFINKATLVDREQQTYVPQHSFSDFAIADKLKRNIAEHGYTHPTPIQDQVIPPLLTGRDVIGIANTGTGKTAAFLIPLINKAYTNRDERTIILTPTRELAMQIVDELHAFTRGMDLDGVLCIGGADIRRQEKKLFHNPHFVIATPGRLKDLIQRKKVNLTLFRNIVLDEVDTMVDIGFIQDVKYFISLLPKKRHSLFFSATVSEKVRSILNDFVQNPVTISVKRQETNEHIEQDIVRVTGGQQKIEILHNLLLREGFDKVLIFGRTKWGVEKLSRALFEKGFKTAAIHGNKSQGQRQRALEQFKQDRVQILLATDVASRGLDIDNVTHVINYDAPESYEDYVHRIGRTGRAGKKGTALTFVE
jgi:superfamily II DNA/RNA helicase